MSDPVFVVESISDGAYGYPYDEILSIAVCRVDLDEGDFDSVFHAVVGWEPKYVGKPKLDYAESKGFDVSSLYGGQPIGTVVRDFKNVIRGKYVTAYDVRQQFGKYLVNAPWDVTLEAHVMPSIMTRQPVSFRCRYPEDEPDTIVKAYGRTFRGKDPAGVGRGRGALELAQMASALMLGLHERGKYRRRHLSVCAIGPGIFTAGTAVRSLGTDRPVLRTIGTAARRRSGLTVPACNS